MKQYLLFSVKYHTIIYLNYFGTTQLPPGAPLPTPSHMMLSASEYIKFNLSLHPTTLLLCACLRQRTRLVYAYVLLTHVSYFSRGKKLNSENGPSRMRDLGHGTICRSPCEHQQPSPGSSRPLKHIFFVVAIRLAEHNDLWQFHQPYVITILDRYSISYSLFRANLFCRLWQFLCTAPL